MAIPIVSACDLFTQTKNDNHVVVHQLSELLKEDMYIPKKPHRHTFYQVLYVKKGSGIHTIDFQELEIVAPVIYFLSPGQVHDLAFKNENIEGILINFDEYFFNSFLSKINYIDDFPFFNKNGEIYSFDVTILPNEIDEIFSKIVYEFTDKKDFFQDAIRLLLLELFVQVNRFQEKKISEKQYSNQQNIISNFEHLLEHNFQKEHYPKFYAERLAITPNYLNLVCKNYLGKTAGEMIRQCIVLETKRLLINSQLSISQISFELHFEDNSYFTKFFKQNTGLTPFQFRNSIK